MAQVVVTVTGAAEGIFLAFNFDHRYFAAPVTLFSATPADKGFSIGDFPIDKGLQIEVSGFHQTGLNAFFHFQGYAKSAHQTGFGRHDDWFAYQGCHGQRYRPVITDTALHEHFFSHRPVAFDPIRIVHAN